MQIEKIIANIDNIQSKEEKLNESFVTAAKNFFSTVSGLIKGKDLDQIRQDRFEDIKAKNDKILDQKKKNLNRLYYLSSLLDELTDKNGERYSINTDIKDGIKKFESAFKSKMFSNYDLKTAKYIKELLDSGHKKELLKLNTNSYELYIKKGKNLTDYILDLLNDKANNDIDNNIDQINCCLSIIEKIIEQVRFNIPTEKCYAFGLSVQEYFNNGRASKKTYDYKGKQLDFSEIFKDICSEINISVDKGLDCYRSIYVNNNINTTHIYQINKFGTYTDYVKAIFNRDGKSIENLIIATLEYSIIDIVRLISEKYKQYKDANVLKDTPIRSQYSKIYQNICDEGLLSTDSIKHLFYISTSIAANGSYAPTNNGGSYFNTEITLKLEKLIALKNISM